MVDEQVAAFLIDLEDDKINTHWQILVACTAVPLEFALGAVK